jgi:hemerythrin-like domain-containing protein
MAERARISRRGLLIGGSGVAGLAIGAGGAVAGEKLTGSATATSVTSPSVDLMHEHGVLKRVLLVYREAVDRLRGGRSLRADALAEAATVVHDFIEGFHEGLEEAYVFPRLQGAGRQVTTVNTLLVQHAHGRRLTQGILHGATEAGLEQASARGRVADDLAGFVRMYEPHEAREDTVIFPAFREVTPDDEFARLGERFAEAQQQQFGRHAFADVVDRVADVEKAFGIYDLSQFTPKAR